jgi:RNA polymerase sigma factor (sigma-70 family)
MKKNNRVKELDDLVAEYQKTKNEDVAKKIYDMFDKGYFKKYGNNDEEISTAKFALARAIDSWKLESNVWFIKWYQMLHHQERIHTFQYNSRKCRTGAKLVPIDGQRYKTNEELLMIETIEDEQAKADQKRRENERLFLEFLEREDITERERMILKNFYFSQGMKQTEIAREMGVSQAMVHKAIRGIHKKPYAEDLRKLLKDMME